MSGCLSENLRCFLKMDHEFPSRKASQEILSTLRCGDDAATRSRAPPCLRKALSEDMSSEERMPENGFFSCLKNIAAPGEEEGSCNSISSKENEEREEECRENRAFQNIWSSIQEERRTKDLERPGQCDTGISVLSQKANDDPKSGDIDGPLPPRYVHPLLRRSSSSLSEDSLKICTESLGSETGSEGFSQYPPAEQGESVERERDYPRSLDGEKFRIVKYDCGSSCKRSPPRSFPPPLPSFAYRDGSYLHLRSHRQNGRLVLEATIVGSQNCFRAQRQDGRLVLILANSRTNEEERTKEDENEMINDALGDESEEIDDAGKEEETNKEEEVEEELENRDAAKELSIIMKPAPKLSAGMMEALKLFTLTKSTTWHHKFNSVIATLEEAEDEESAASPPPRVARLLPAATAIAASVKLNSYEHYWGHRPAALSVLKFLPQQTAALKANHNAASANNKSILAHNYNHDRNSREQEEVVVVVKGRKTDYVVPLSFGCKEQRRRRPLLRWELCGIATT
ncbi:hypothetical protein Nepgr_012981 [Nepenthes gracilis]|uniref:FAF domain-containing protein n=1 Tax=Nepenthes gracilis TaxID=150966 RepID=A0AAD3SHW8_NEPGR|nr:hypothetical protein Nepgr_012981 [Nepenthes gracilis]